MKSLLIFLSLWSFALLGFSQQASKPSQWQIGLSNYSYFANQYRRNLDDQIVLNTPFASRWGLAAINTIGEHFGLGVALNYRRWQGTAVLPMDPLLMIIYVPVEERYQEFTQHYGLLDLFGRWYVQEKSTRLRIYAQMGLAAEARLGGQVNFPLSRSEEAQIPQKIAPNFQGLLASYGIGLQYRLSPHWRLESALLTYWPGGLAGKPFVFNQYGLNLGLYHTL